MLPFMATIRLKISGELSAEDLQKIIADSASYRTRKDIVMCENFIDAAEALLAVPLSEFDHAGERASLDVGVSQERLDKAIDWLETERACALPPRHFIPARDWSE